MAAGVLWPSVSWSGIKELCHQIMWVKCFDITGWKASHTILQSVILLPPSAEIIAVLNRIRKVGSILPIRPVQQQQTVDLGRKTSLVDSVSLRGISPFSAGDISYPGLFMSYFRRPEVQLLPLLGLELKAWNDKSERRAQKRWDLPVLILPSFSY